MSNLTIGMDLGDKFSAVALLGRFARKVAGSLPSALQPARDDRHAE